MRVSFLAPAQDELDEAVAWYEQQQAGLGQQFAQEVRDSITRIVEHPLSWQRVKKDARRCRTRRFPYAVLYRASQEEILIVAVTHMHRKPGYWENRLR